jgi:hypothetical protein
VRLICPAAKPTTDTIHIHAEDPHGRKRVFTSPKGGLRDPSNTSAHLRKAFDGAGFD